MSFPFRGVCCPDGSIFLENTKTGLKTAFVTLSPALWSPDLQTESNFSQKCSTFYKQSQKSNKTQRMFDILQTESKIKQNPKNVRCFTNRVKNQKNKNVGRFTSGKRQFIGQYSVLTSFTRQSTSFNKNVSNV
jgi:hypothetical protein